MSRLKSYRIFHDKTARDFEYEVYGIDEENYLVHQRAIYNQITENDMILVDWLINQGVKIEELKFDQFQGKNSQANDIPEDAKDHEKEFIEKLNRASKNIENTRFEKANNFCIENKHHELKDGYLFDKDFGLFIKTEYNTYESKQFNAELGSLITFSIMGFDDLETVKNEYKFFKDFIYENKNKLIDEFYALYKIYKDDVYEGEPKEFLDQVCPTLEKKRDVLSLIEYEFLEIMKEEGEETEYLLSGEATWDMEHGFRFLINKKGG